MVKKKYYIERPDWFGGLVLAVVAMLVSGMIFGWSFIITGLAYQNISLAWLVNSLIYGLAGFVFGSFIEKVKVEVKEVKGGFLTHETI